MRILRNGALAVLAVVVLALGWIIVSDRMAQPAPADTKPLIAKAAQYHPRIRRDDWGVPHISGPTDPDVAFGLAFLVKTFLVQAFWIPSGSMENTQAVDDRVLVNKVVYHLRPLARGAVVVFNGVDSFTPEVQVATPSGPAAQAV